MKVLHTADVHIGKRVCGMPMKDEQLHVIEQLVAIAKDEDVDCIIIAGDVFDRSIPSRDALELCERLFLDLCALEVPVFVIPGNHDAPQQLSFCSGLMQSSGLHIAKAYHGQIEYFDLAKDQTKLRVHLLPFVRPTDVRMAHPELADQISTHNDAVRVALSHDEILDGACNLLVAHQFVVSGSAHPETCDSEIISLGGTDSIEAELFDAYDYVALGHLHGPQHVHRETIRYSGSPLKYSFSEVHHEKSVTILDFGQADVRISTRKMLPLHDMREITASYSDLLQGIDTKDPLDYLRVRLMDTSLPDAMAKLRNIYPNIMRLDWETAPDLADSPSAHGERARKSSPVDLFAAFYESQTGNALTDDERDIVKLCLEDLEGHR